MDLYEKKQLRYKYIFITVLLVCIATIVSSSITYYYLIVENASISFIGKTNVESDSDSDETIVAISKTIKGFRNIIDSEFKGEIDEQKLLDGAVKGYVDRTW